MIYLSQLILNPASRMAQSETRNPYERHRTLMRGFAAKREQVNMLHRLDINPYSGMITLLVQSTVEPDWQSLAQVGQGDYLLAPPQWKAIELSLPRGRVLRFRLTANPTIKKVRRDDKGERLHSNRVPLVHEAKQQEWLVKQGEQHGFQISPDNLVISDPSKQKGRKEGESITLYTVQFEGYLQVTNSAQFIVAVQTGIGPARAFGCGLLSLAPA